LKTFHSLTIILVLTIIIGLLASFGSQNSLKSHYLAGIVQEKAPQYFLENH